MAYVIAFEGIDLAGKSTLIKALLKKCSDKGVRADVLNSKDDTTESLALEILRRGHIPRQAEFMSYSLGRISKFMEYKALQSMDFIFMDRSYFTNLAYGEMLLYKDTVELLSIIEKNMLPIDHVVLLTMDFKTYRSRARRNTAANPWESHIETMMKVDRIYRRLVNETSLRTTQISGAVNIKDQVEELYSDLIVDKLIIDKIKK